MSLRLAAQVLFARLRPSKAVAIEFALLTASGFAAAYLAVIFPALDYHYTALFQHARFAAVVVVSGTDATFEDVSAAAGERPVLPVQKHMATVSAAGTRAETDVWVMRDSDLSKHTHAYFSDSLLMRGKPRRGAVALSAPIAERLGVRLDDRVELNVGEPRFGRQLELSQPLSGVWQPLDGLEGALVGVPAARFDQIASAAVETHFFVGGSERALPDAVMRALSKVADKGNGVVITPPHGVLSQRQRFRQSLGRYYSYATTAVAMLIYLLVIWRTGDARIRRSQRMHAILSSLGARPALLVGITAAEQTLVSVSAATVGALVARRVLADANRLYIPRESMSALGLVMLALIVGAATMSAVSAYVRLRRLPVSRLLASAAY